MTLKAKWRILIIICLGIFMSTLDSSILNVANPAIADNFSVSLEAVQWLVTAYMLTITSTLLLFGRIGDLWGKEKIYSLGFVVFTLGSWLCSQAPGFDWLIGFRVIQALGASMMMATGVGIVSGTFPDHQRGKALGLTGGVVGIGNMAGPSIGGILVDQLGWSSIFLVNVPIGIISIILAYRYLVPVSARQGDKDVDIAGTILWAMTTILLIISLSPDLNKIWLAAAVVLLLIFLAVEKRTPHSIWDFDLFKVKPFTFGNILGLTAYTSHAFVFFLLPFYLQDLLLLTPLMTGLYMTIPPLIMAFMAPLAGNLSDRWGPSLLTSIAFVLLVLSYSLFAALPAYPDPLHISASLALLGLGMATFGSPNSSSIMGSVAVNKSGYAGGFISTVRNFSYSVGTALAAAIFSAVITQNADSAEAYLVAVHSVYQLGIGLCLAGLVISLVTGGIRKRTPENTGVL